MKKKVKKNDAPPAPSPEDHAREGAYMERMRQRQADDESVRIVDLPANPPPFKPKGTP